MDWETWRPKYEQISKRLGLDQKSDEKSAIILNKLIPKSDIMDLKKLIKEKECIIFGAGPSLEMDIKKIRGTENMDKVLISVNGATSAVIKYTNPDIIVTDLDGEVNDQIKAWNRGSWLVIHGHGDNVESIRNVVPEINERIIGTTQTKAFGKIYNFGGFTDGDRAAFMANELGASKIYLAGMDLGDKIGKWSGRKNKSIKIMKLEICMQLLTWLTTELDANIINITSKGMEIPGIPKCIDLDN